MDSFRQQESSVNYGQHAAARRGPSSPCVVERQSNQECGLCALRHVLMPHLASDHLPTAKEFRWHARALESQETSLLKDDATGLMADVARADVGGNFSVDVLMQAARCRMIEGQHLRLEYWAGQHRELSWGRELGFIIGSGAHWWAIRKCGNDLQEWEEVDSLGKQAHVDAWRCTDDLHQSLLGRHRHTVLVLYASPEDDHDDDLEMMLRRVHSEMEEASPAPFRKDANETACGTGRVRKNADLKALHKRTKHMWQESHKWLKRASCY